MPSNQHSNHYGPFQRDDAAKRVGMQLQVGWQTKEVDSNGLKAVHHLPDEPKTATNPLEKSALAASRDGATTWIPHKVGEMLVMACPSGDRSNAIPLCAQYNDENPRPPWANANTYGVRFGPESKPVNVYYDSQENTVFIDLSGNTSGVVVVNSPTVVINAEHVEINSNTTIKGDLEVVGNINGQEVSDREGSMANLRTKVRTQHNAHTHTTPSGPSGPPQQPMTL